MPNIDTLSIQFNANGTDKAVENIKRMGYAVRNLAQSVKSIDASKLGVFTSSMESLKKSVPTESQTRRMLDFASAIKDLSAAIGTSNVGSFATDMSTLGEAVQTFKKSSVNSISNAATAMKNLGTQAKETASVISTAVPKKSQQISGGDNKAQLSQTKELVAALDKVEIKTKATQSILAKLGMYVPTKKFKSLEENAEKVRAKYEEVRATLQKSLNNGEVESGGTEYKKKMAELDALKNKYNELIQKQRELAQEGKRFTIAPGLQKAYSGVKTSVSNLKSSFSAAQGAIGSVNKHISNFIGKLRSLGSHTKKTKGETNALSLSAKKLASEFFRVSKMLKLMITRMALRKVISEVGDGFKSLALHSEEFNRSMSGLMNGSKQLGYSFAAMVSPLINALAPALEYIISLLIKFINIVNQVVSSIAGFTTWNKAKDFTESWADNIEAANKSGKELKKTVLGFDELNQLQEKTKGGGDTSKNIKDMFETMPIEAKWKGVADYIKSIAKKLFDPIKKAWEKVGDFVKKSWKKAMNEVLNLGKSVARDFWKVWEQKATQQIFENILKIIGYIGQTVGNLARQFRKAWDENNTGYKILCKIRDIILTITEHFVNMAKATADWADNLDFSPILKKFDEWLGSFKPVIDNLMGVVEDFYKTVILPLAKWAVEEGGPKLLQVFIDFNNKVDWDGLRNKLKTLWEHLEPFMQTVGEGLIIFIDRCAQALANFLNSEKFENFLKTIEDWMDSVKPDDVADALEMIAKAIVGFAIGKAVVDGMVAIANFLTLIKNLAPMLKLAVVVSVAIEGLEAGKTIGSKIFPDDKELYEHYSGVTGSVELMCGTVKGLYDDLLMYIEDIWNSIVTAAKFAKATMDLIWGKTSLAEWSRVAADWAQAQNKVASFGDDPSIQGWANLRGEIYKATEDADKFNEIVNKSINEGTNKAVTSYATSFSKVYNELTNGNNETATSFSKVNEELKKVNNEGQGFQKIGETAKNVKVELGDFVNPLLKVKENTKQATTSSKEWIDTVTKGTTEVKASYEGVSASVDNVKKNTPLLTEEQKKLTNAFEGTANVAPKFTQAQKDIEAALGGASKATKDFDNTTKVSWSSVDSVVANASVGFVGSVNDISKGMDDCTKDLTDQTKKISEAFSEDKWTFKGVAEGLKETFLSAKTAIKGVWNSIAEKVNGQYDFGNAKFKINLPTFARGGFPEDGLFMANHNELVGQFDNGKTAVANNTQIIEGISAGVYNAVTSAMSNSNSGKGGYISNTIVVDGEVIARTVTKAQEKQNRRYSPQTV